MTKLSYFIILIVVSFNSSFAQVPNFPWAKDIPVVNGKIYMEDVKDAAENYFSGIDRYAKGSGYKPYMRWLENWEYSLLEDGSLPTATDLTQNWNNFKNFENSFSPESTNGDWAPLGPFTYQNQGSWSTGQGRISVITIAPSNSNIIYIGAPDGGLWKSEDHGDSWTPLSDFLPSIGVSGIAVDYNDPNTLYISTGDENHGHSLSAGIFKSTDGGITWIISGFTANMADYTGEIYIHPTNSSILWVVSNTGLYKSTDAGANWSLKINEDIREVRLKPGDPNIIYAVGYGEFYRSTDSGETFFQIPDPSNYFTDSGRMAIATTVAEPNYVYAVVSNSDSSFRSLYLSMDSGETFTDQNPPQNIFIGNQSWYDLAITVSDTNPNLVFVGEIDIWKSDDSGQNFVHHTVWNDPESSRYTHADIHDLKYYNNRLYCASDGGIYMSDDEGDTFINKTSGLQISQLYRISLDPNNSNNIAGGLQDNGGFARIGENWVNYYGADGMEAAIDPTNPNLYYGLIQYGSQLYKIDVSDPNNNGEFVLSGLSGMWITPMVINSQGQLLVCTAFLYRLNDAEDSWELASFYNFGAAQRHMEIDPNNDDHIITLDNSRGFRSTDGGLNFTQMILPQSLGGFWLEISHNNSDVFWLIDGNRVYKSNDAGNSWIDITTNLPNGITLYCLAHQKDSPNNSVYLGTDKSVFYYDDDQAQWTPFNENLPHVRIRDLEINTAEGNIVAATYGRGVWRSPVSDSSLGIENSSNGNTNYFIYPNPSKEIFKINFSSQIPTEIKVYDVNGKTIYFEKLNSLPSDHEIHLKNKKSGIYIVQIKNRDHLITKKILLKK